MAQGELGVFDRFAESVSSFASSATYFVGCVVLVVVWAPSILLFRNLDTWQLVINTATTIVTFLAVALLQNSQRRFENAMNAKLNAMAEGVADMMEAMAQSLDSDKCDALVVDADELRRNVGIEDRISAD